MTTSNNNDIIIYPDEEIVSELRESFDLFSTGYISRSSLVYVLDAVRHLYNEKEFLDALVAKAAYILLNIVTLHPFIDGNKRTAYGTADIFLRLNGYCISVNPLNAVEFIVKAAQAKSDETKLAKWIRQHLKKLPR